MKIIHITPSVIKEPGVGLESLDKASFGSWAGRYLKRYCEITNNSSFKYECWCTYNIKIFGDRGIKEGYRSGITYKLFPAFTVGSVSFSFSLIRTLLSYKKRHKILVHMHSMNNLLAYAIAFFLSDRPLVAQARSPNYPALIKYVKKRKLSYFLLSILEKVVIKNFDYVFTPSKIWKKYLEKFLGEKKVRHLKGGGFNFNTYKIPDKIILREKYNIDTNLKLMIHVGRYNKTKGIIDIFDTFERLFKLDQNLMFIFVGGNKDEPLYYELRQKFEKYKDQGRVLATGTRIPKKKLIDLLAISDFYLGFFDKNEIINMSNFGDIDNTMLEALAMNVPVISPTLIHIPCSKEELRELGIVVTNTTDLFKASLWMLKNSTRYDKCRNIIKKYYSWDYIINPTSKIYERLINNYYKLDYAKRRIE